MNFLVTVNRSWNSVNKLKEEKLVSRKKCLK